MEFMKKNIHMDCCRYQTSTQITVEEDFVIPDVKSDMREVVFEKCQIRMDDAKTTEDRVSIQGEMEVAILYQPEEGQLAVANKSIPIREEIYLEGVKSGDNVDVKWAVEDLNVSMINSRKVNIRALLQLQILDRHICDEEVTESFQGLEDVEYRQKSMQVAGLTVCKKDIYRARKEIEISNHLPNIKEILWSDVQGNHLDFRMQSDKIFIKGEFPFFVLYEGEGEDGPIRFMESTIPIEGEIPCSGVEEGMISHIDWHITHVEVEKKPDFDGEERVITVDLVCGMDIRLYEENEISLLSDVYGVSKEINVKTTPATFRQLLIKNDGVLRLDERVHPKISAPILQLLHQEGEVLVEDVYFEEEQLGVDGTLFLKCLYVTGEDTRPYGSFQYMLPFHYAMDVKRAKEEQVLHVNASVDQMSITMTAADEVNVKAQVGLHIVAFDQLKENIICSMDVQELNQEKIKNLPGMAIYVVKEGDSLWDIGKKYYVPVSRIKEVNNLTKDECKPLDKLLVVRV